MRAIYPEDGPIPRYLCDFARVPGFVSLAKKSVLVLAAKEPANTGSKLWIGPEEKLVLAALAGTHAMALGGAGAAFIYYVVGGPEDK